MTQHQQIYQLRLRIVGISPMIWRRILVKSDTSIANLHYIIQILMGWTDEYLHNFKIHGKEYGIYKIGGAGFSDDPHKIILSTFGLVNNALFTYKYNYFASWKIEIRVEDIDPTYSSKFYPVCIDGKRKGPPEEIRGPIKFMEMEDYYCNWKIMELVQDDLERYKSGDIGDGELSRSFAVLHYWITKNDLKRRKINKTLELFGKQDSAWEERLIEEAVS